MRKAIVAFLIAVTGSALVFGCAKGYESQKTADDLTITLSAARYPLVKGDNTLTVKATDTAGKAVKDATVNVRTYMPPMPGMAPMEFTTQATLKGDHYAVTATFNVDAR